MGSKPKTNGRHPSADEAKAVADAVAEAKGILADLDRETSKGWMRLGALAYNLTTTYSEKTLAKFADGIDVSACTLERYRSVYAKWKDIPAPGPISYAVMRELQTHPDRAEIVKKQPGLTKAAARKIMRKYKEQIAKDGGKEEGSADEDWQKETKRWFKRIVHLANEIVGTANLPKGMTPEKRQTLRKVVAPELLAEIRGAAEQLIWFVNQVNAHLAGDDAEEEVSPEEEETETPALVH